MAVNPLALLGGVGAVALGVVGGLYVTGSGTSEDNTEPGWHSLSEDAGYANAGYSSKYGEKYKRFLTGVTLTTAQDGKEAHNNDSWWEWAFNNRYEKNKTKAKGKFSDLKKGTEGNDSLKAVCKTAYQEQVNSGSNNGKIKTTDQGITNNDFLESNIWLFCSVKGTQPTTVFESTSEGVTYGNSSYGATEDIKKKLVSTKVEANNWFWKMQEEMFSKLTSESGLNSGSEFKTLYDGKANNVKPGQTLKVKETCQKAYQETESKDTKYPKADVGKFCTLEGVTLS